MRMSEASARMHLRDSVREDDVDLAIKVCIEMSIQCVQRHDILSVPSHFTLCFALLWFLLVCFASDCFT